MNKFGHKQATHETVHETEHVFLQHILGTRTKTACQHRVPTAEHVQVLQQAAATKDASLSLDTGKLGRGRGSHLLSGAAFTSIMTRRRRWANKSRVDSFLVASITGISRCPRYYRDSDSESEIPPPPSIAIVKFPSPSRDRHEKLDEVAKRPRPGARRNSGCQFVPKCSG